MAHSTGKEEKEKEKEQDVRTPSKPRTLIACLRALNACLFSHKPLYTTLPYPDSIRLLRIHPGKPVTNIRCTLQPARLDVKLPFYEALSYVWLAREGEKSIICNGHKKQVPTNLFDALERLRYRKNPRLIWVDNLCIHQEDLNEKNHQVRQMHRLYAKAARVVVWLGVEGSSQADAAFATLCTLVNAHREEEEVVSYSTVWKQKAYTVQCTYSPPPPDSKSWIDVMALFTNKWFVRMWVLQEIALARNATLIWGSAEVDWEVIGFAIQIIRSKLPYLNLVLECRAFQNANIMYHLGKLQQSSLKSSTQFLQLLDLSRSFDVTYPKDKVYGLLGFLNTESSQLVPPDYKCSLAEIYTHVARNIVLLGQNLDILSFTSITDPSTTLKDPGLPSWVPNWNSKDVIYPFMSFGKRDQHKASQAKNSRIKFYPGQYLNVLGVRGAIVDVVMDALPSFPFTELHESTPNLSKIVEWCIDSTASFHPATLASTLTGGRTINGTLITDSTQHLADFMALLRQLHPECLENIYSKPIAAVATPDIDIGNPDQAREAVWRYSCYRSPFLTETGKLGLGPGAVKRRDVVVVLLGGQVPYILREEAVGWRFVGECYVEGMMKGEALKSEMGNVERYFELR